MRRVDQIKEDLSRAKLQAFKGKNRALDLLRRAWRREPGRPTFLTVCAIPLWIGDGRLNSIVLAVWLGWISFPRRSPIETPLTFW